MGISWLADYTKDHYSCVYWVSSAFVHIFFYPLWLKQKKRERERSVSVRKFFSYYFVEQRGKETCTLVSPRKTTKQQHPIWKMVYPLRFFFFSISKANSEYFIFFFFLLNLWTRTYYFHEERNLNTMIIWFVKNPSFGDTRAPYVFALTVSFRSFLIP